MSQLTFNGSSLARVLLDAATAIQNHLCYPTTEILGVEYDDDIIFVQIGPANFYREFAGYEVETDEDGIRLRHRPSGTAIVIWCQLANRFPPQEIRHVVTLPEEP